MLRVQDLLAVAALRLHPVHLPDAGTAIRWVATSELVDPTPFLEGGEVLLTTGLETAHWVGEWDRYVRRLADAGVVAVGLAVDLTHPASPDALVSACRRHEVNLFEVPRETTFVSISRTSARMLDSARHAAMADTLAVQRRLTEAAMRPDAGRAVLTVLASTGATACIVSPEGTVEHGPYGVRPEALGTEVVAEQVHRMRPRGMRAAANVDTADGALLVHPLGLRSRPSGYLAARFAGRPTALHRASVATAVALLSMAVEQEHQRLEDDRRVRARALAALIEDDDRTARELLSVRPDGARTPLPRRSAVLRARGGARSLEDALSSVEARHPLSGLLDGELVVAVRPRETGEVVTALTRHGLRVGTGEAVPTSRLGRGFRTAGHAVTGATERTPVSWQEDVGRGVLSLLDRERAGDFATAFLGPLLEDHVLVQTLRSFLLHHGSQLRVAEDLGVHRNTVRHRVQRIEAVLGGSLADARMRVDAWVALQALEIPEGGPG